MKTVQELIDALMKEEDKTRIVWLEGCDCAGEWNGKIDPRDWKGDPPSIMLGRDN